ncbi:hypothetical protein [Kitasatospora sp. NPDC088783]|uniref:hypothetical protein n=1 Tax=Kitasatospora sp. NPDC088783 TaxID=3364077 RepID=UPI003822BBE1
MPDSAPGRHPPHPATSPHSRPPALAGHHAHPGPTGACGEQTFAVRALTHVEALAAAATTAHTHPALRHRRGARLDTAAARAALHH